MRNPIADHAPLFATIAAHLTSPPRRCGTSLFRGLTIQYGEAHAHDHEDANHTRHEEDFEEGHEEGHGHAHDDRQQDVPPGGNP